MKVHFEATLHESHEGAVELDADEAAEFLALTTDEARHKWLTSFVREVVFDGDHKTSREVDTDNAFWYVEDDDGERHNPLSVQEPTP